MAANCIIEPDCDCGGDCDCVRYGDLFALQEEAQINLGAIFTTEVAYFGENNTYAQTFQDLAWSPEGETRYAYLLPMDEIQPNLRGPYYPPPGMGPEVTGTGFSVMAVGNIDCDDTPDIWIINDQKWMINLVNDVTK
jgi:hypothetical protein